MSQDEVRRAADVLRSATRVMAFTGAGVSAESGVATFRGAGGLWEGHRIEEVAAPDAFAADPARVWRFYDQRRTNVAQVVPNRAHRVLAAWQDRFPSFALVTQNVDGLHQGAGSRGVVELHGSLWRVRCTGCGREREERAAPMPALPPRCAACGAIERPGVVWFGEALPVEALRAAQAAAEACEVLVVVGTSAVVYPAAGVVAIAAAAGAKVIEVNPEASALAHLAGVTLRGPAGEMLPQVDAMLAGGLNVRVAELAREERPREKLLSRGPEALSDAELLALLLRTGTAGTDVLALAEKLLSDAGGLAGLAAADRRMILRAKGVGPAKGAVVAAALEVGRRLARLALQGQPLLDRPEIVAEYLARSYGSSRVEKFGTVTLDARNRLLQVHELHRGARSHADVEPSEVFNSAILDNAHALIVWHTHPSGDPAPSEDDVTLTRRLADAGRLLNIPVLDHIVVGRSGFVSLRQRGVLAAR